MKALFLLSLLSFSAMAEETPKSRLDEAWWAKRWKEQTDIAAQGDHNILFIGDSITQNFNKAGKAMWDKYYVPRKALNFGFSGDRTEHVIWRLQNTDWSTIKPKVTVIMIGTNNTGHKLQAAESTADGVKEIVKIIRKKLPDSNILLLGLLPREFKHDHKKRIRNEEVNAIISKLHNGENIYYVDLKTVFLNDDRAIDKSIMADGLHPTPKGYQLWVEAMEPHLVKLLEK